MAFLTREASLQEGADQFASELHADDPTALQPPKMDVAVLCVRCHEAGIAKPATFPQVKSEEHSGGVVCNTCHQPHSPRIGDATTASTDKPSGDSK